MDCEVEQYCLRWKYHHSNLQFMFAQLLENQSLCDVTLACEGKTLRVHKIMLSACSAYFDSIFSKYEENDPIVILEGIKFENINALVEFMYRGEITVDKSKLNDLIETAEELQVKGLAAVSWRSSEGGWSSVGGNDFNDDSDSSNLQNPLNGSKRKFMDPGMDDRMSNQGHLSDDGMNYNYPQSAFPPFVQYGGEAQPKVPIPSSETSPFLKKRKLSDIPKIKSSNSLSENDSDCEKDVPSRLVKAAETALPVISNILSLTSTPEKPPPPMDFSDFKVTKMSDHIQQGGWRPHFWELESTRRVMEAIKSKKIEMKTGAEILGVTYGTLYGRYREIHGYLKQPQREFWHDVRYSDILSKLKKKEISLFKAADLMNITATALANHLAKTEREGEEAGMVYSPDIKFGPPMMPQQVPIIPSPPIPQRAFPKLQKDNLMPAIPPPMELMNASLMNPSLKPSTLISKLTANKEVKLIKTDSVTLKPIKLEKPVSSGILPETSLIKISSSDNGEPAKVPEVTIEKRADPLPKTGDSTDSTSVDLKPTDVKCEEFEVLKDEINDAKELSVNDCVESSCDSRSEAAPSIANVKDPEAGLENGGSGNTEDSSDALVTDESLPSGNNIKQEPDTNSSL